MRRADHPLRRLPAVHQRPWAVGVYLGVAALVGLAWAAPIANLLGSVTGAYPRGDAELYDPGALLLLEALQRTEPAGPATAAAWIVVAVIALPLGMFALGFSLAQLGTPGRSRPSWALVRAARALPTLALLGVLALVANAVIGAVLMIAGGAISRAAWPIPPARDVARLALLGLVLLASFAISAIHDLARAAAVIGPSRTYMSIRAALLVVWRAPLRVAWSFVWRLLAGLSSIVIAFSAGLAIGKRGALAIALSALVHQLGLAAAGWARLSWLSEAARHVRPVLALAAKKPREQAPPPTDPAVGEADPAAANPDVPAANLDAAASDPDAAAANLHAAASDPDAAAANLHAAASDPDAAAANLHAAASDPDAAAANPDAPTANPHAAASDPDAAAANPHAAARDPDAAAADLHAPAANLHAAASEPDVAATNPDAPAADLDAAPLDPDAPAGGPPDPAR